MKTFNQFITEAYDKDVVGRSQITKQGEGGRIGSKRKKDIADQPSPLSVQKKPSSKARVKAVGGGKTAPSKSYKDRKDIGIQRPRSTREQQPTKERGSAALSPREAQKKARAERLAAKSGAKTKTADELLRKKKKKTVSPDYKPVKATGYTAAERQKITRAGRRLVRDIAQGKEKPISHYDPGVRKG